MDFIFTITLWLIVYFIGYALYYTTMFSVVRDRTVVIYINLLYPIFILIDLFNYLYIRFKRK
jgi:hypothetical protein